MTYAPATITQLAAYWVAEGGVNAGIVGNSVHCKGYHLGKDRIYGTCACKPGGVCKPGLGDADYSVKHARDKAGLTNASAGFDMGRLDGTLANLQAFSKWLVARCKADATGYRDIREIIYSPDGVAVKRWDNYAKVLYTGGDGTGQGDNSHRWHTHVSFARDSETRDKRPMWRPYFEPAVTPGGPMPAITSYIPGQLATVKASRNVRTAPSLTAPVIRVTAATEAWVVTGWVKGSIDPECASDDWITRWAGGQWEYTTKCNLAAGPAPAPDTSPYTKADLDAAKAEGQVQGAAEKDAAWETWLVALPSGTHP
jgi:hypothetical protein